ncbi:2-phosphosulfolactate phosphatase family protein [Clostridium sp. MSJ-4]|uniref:Probable 2-phosphosulfolactate phosphatase n=1 Tax=Clostridium simiarum TaxID=2841506 RepID=A0ABS6F2Q7_9CLOT|nr:2-phosphosulfolactate phosphatase family protein [Clostridium simiarum]MBU5592175.1 2-phosphosulfolactate phosphatase family protein [Clostridium simiarum]
MKIDVIISADDIKDKVIEDKTVVVIDILRATSVIVTALSNGCSKVIPVLTVEEAFDISKEDRRSYILGGERRALKIDGFDFSNSPLEYTKELVEGKTVILTTSNGTRAIKGCSTASAIYIGAMLNAKSIAKKIIEEGRDVVFVNAGTLGQFSMDDFICGGYMINCILQETEAELTDIAKTANYVYENNKDIYSFIKDARHYGVLKSLELDEDLSYCIKKDIIEIIPEYKEGIIKPLGL